MIQIKKQEMGPNLFIELTGSIEEDVNFDKLIGPFTGELTVKCREITRINSVGVKAWMAYFHALRRQGKNFRFTECSLPIVNQLNSISNFACGGQIVSVSLPYYCSTCKKEFVADWKTADLKASGLEAPNAKCERTDCNAKFDDDPEEYFFFLED